MHTAREIYLFISTNGKLLSLLLTLGQKTVLAGAVTVEGAGLEKGVKGLPLHAFRIPVPHRFMKRPFLGKGVFLMGIRVYWYTHL